MHRIDTATKAADLFGAGKHGFKDGDKANGIPATDLTAAFFNDLQETIAQVIEAAGIVLAKGTYDQLVLALIKKGMQGGYFCTGAGGGTVDAITSAFSPAITALYNGMCLDVRAAGANTVVAPTFTPNAGTIPAKTIVKGNNLPLVAGDIAGAGYWMQLAYDNALDKWILLNPAAGIGSPYVGVGYMLARDEKASGTDGGAAAAGGTATRVLNTVSANTISGASLASNQITLPAGTYRINATIPGSDVNQHRAYLYNVTDASISLLGTSENASGSAGGDTVTTPSLVRGRLTIAAAKVFEVRHYTQTAVAGYGLGKSVSNSGVEVYSTIEIIKEA